MKILFPYLARWKAVNWTRYHSLLGRLAEMGNQVYVLQPPPMRSQETNFQEIDVDVGPNVHLEEIRLNRFFWNLKFPLNKLVKKGYYASTISSAVKRIVQQEKIDVMLLYNLPHYPLLNVSGCKKVFDLADDYVAMLKQELGRAGNGWLLRYGKSVLDKMMEQSDVTTCVSHVLAEKAKGNVAVLPNGVDLNALKRGSGTKIRADLKPPVVGFIGSFEYFIDFGLILEAARCLPDVTFLLVGSGREWRRVRKETQDQRLENVVMPGGVPHERAFEYIDAMDVCLNIFKKIPISHGACPIKLFEYLGMKKPVISTRLDEVQRIDTGYLFYADSPGELIETLVGILNKDSRTRQMAERGYQVVCEEYNWDRIASRFLRLIGQPATAPNPIMETTVR